MNEQLDENIALTGSGQVVDISAVPPSYVASVRG